MRELNRTAALFCAALAAALPLYARATVKAQSHLPAPSSVTIAGSLQTELGCPADWDAACANTHLTWDAADEVWQGTFSLPAGTFEYKAALNDDWSVSYGGPGDTNLGLTLGAPRSVKFYYSHATHWTTSNAGANVAIATAAGSFQSELGCAGDWQPDCLRSWLQDPDGDGTYTFSTTAIPAGSYETKVAIDESWTESYGQGGSPDGANIAFTVPFDGAEMTFRYDGSTHVLSISARQGAQDGNVSWSDLRHDSRDSAYRTPGGAVPAGTAVTVRLRALGGDLTGAHVRVWNDRTNSEAFVAMTLAANDGLYDWWEATLAPGSDPTILWYRFIARDGAAAAYYEDDVARDGGAGETLGASVDRSWQITAYDPAFSTPEWAKNGIVYQIFPDRFRNGNAANDTPAGSFFYGEAGGTIQRSTQTDWNETVCDPRDGGGPCPAKYSNNFYGGDLQGIVDKLPYLSDLGVTVLYLNPIFESPSNHKYDTSDFTVIDDNFGDLTVFQSLTTQAHALGMKVVLDGVFNHTSSDSRYFDRYHRYGSPDGACESTFSMFRNWYYFQPAGTPGSGVCAGDTFYSSWAGYDSLPKLDSTNPATRQLIWDDSNAVARYWLAQGADGWRLDVGGDIDPGVTDDPSNDYWEGFRAAVRSQKSDAWIVGEEWGLATRFTLGGEWDATMNYQFSSAILGFWRDEVFFDNDHDANSSAGVLSPLTPSQLDARLHDLRERYPSESFYAMMNLLGSHDTNRALFMLDHRTDENNPSIYASATYDWSDAIARLKGAALLQMTLPGAPTIYYGDEVGLVGPVAYAGGKWEDDPYNRQPYPWLDESGTPFYPHLRSGGAGEGLRAYYQLLAATRNAHAALRTGSFDTLLVDDANDAYAYGRKLADSSDAAVVIVNRNDAGPRTIAVNVAGYLPEGAQFHDVLNANAPYVVTGGVLTVPNVAARGGALLVLASAMAPAPAAVTDLSAAAAGSDSVTLAWSAASGASSYDVYESLLSGGGYTFAGNAATPGYTVTGLTPGVRSYFVVVSRNDTTGLRSGNSNEISAVPVYDLSDGNTSWYNVQWPPSITHTISTTTRTPDIFSQIWIDGVTADPGAPANLRAQVGYGVGAPTGSSWRWVDMTYHTQVSNNDEFVGSLLPDAVGDYHYAARYSGDGGATWWYADLSGPQRAGFLSNPGTLQVNASSDSTAPTALQGLTVVSSSPSSIGLSWPASEAEDLSGYEIFRAPGASSAFVRIASVAAATTSFTDFSVAAGASYRYHVKAYDTSFNRSAQSNIVEASAAPRSVAVTFQVTVPAFTPPASTVYIVGDIAELGTWDPALVATTKVDATHWTYTLHVPEGTSFDYKFTRGSWESVEKLADGTSEVTHEWTASYGTTGAETIDVTVENWRDPIVVSHAPAAGATGVAAATAVAVSWSQQMQAGTDFQVSSPSGSVAGTFAYDGVTRTTTFTPDAPLLQGTSYSVSVTGERSAANDLQLVPVSWTFTTACNVPTPTITAGGELTFCQGGSVLLTSSSTTGNQWYRNGAPIAGATSRTYSANATGSYTVVVTIDGCTTSPSNAIDVAATSAPAAPAIEASGPTTFCAGGSVTFTSSSATGNQWYRDGAALPGETGQSLVASLAGSYTVTATSAGCTSAPSVASVVTVNPAPDATIAVASTMNSGARSTASVNVSCIGAAFSWSISGGTITDGDGTPRVTFTAGAAGTLTLTVTVQGAGGCTRTTSADVDVQLAPFGAPPDFHATANATSAFLQWAAVQSAQQYEVYRSSDNVNWTLRGTTGATTFTDTALTSATAYLYRVRAVDAQAAPSAFSGIDFATTLVFSDSPLACAPVIRAAHVVELRQAINLVRASVGLAPATFTDPSLSAGTVIKAAHLTRLRSALAPALAAIGVTPSYTDPIIAEGVTTAKAAHITEVRDLVR